MKSAYELAMERLDKSSPTVSLTKEQIAELASIDQSFTAKIAEKELFLNGLISKAKETGNFGELTQLEEQKVRELTRLREKLEEEKDKVRNAG